MLLRIAFVFLVFIHGLIHFMGFFKAFALADLKELTLPISKPFGILWLLAGILFVATGVCYLFKENLWWVLALLALFLSQVIIFSFWKDAKFGTIANIIVFIGAIVAYGSWSFENQYHKDVEKSMLVATSNEVRIITAEDLQHLPAIVQQYLNYVGVVGKPQVQQVKIEFTGEMRSREQDWFSFTSEQHNFFDPPTRLFFMKAKVKGIPTDGYHAYQNGKASMKIKLLSLFPVVSEKGEMMDESETVTFFNDLCLFAPSQLVDENIQWEVLNAQSVKAFFQAGDHRISATLIFNKKGQLVNFISEDRSDISDRKKYTFSTPVAAYENRNGYHLCSYGEAVWHYPERAFTYGKFRVENISYSLK